MCVYGRWGRRAEDYCLAKALFVLDSSLFVLLEFQWLDYWVRGQQRLLQQENVPDFHFRRVVPL